ncbi:hypothetical protein Tco_1524764 [Tanacetum coccineum]
MEQSERFLMQESTASFLRSERGRKTRVLTLSRDFPEVFPEDLLALTTKRQVESQLDLVPRCCKAPTKEEHDAHPRLILELLKKEELYAKFLKCDFWLLKVQFLGHMIDSEGIHVDPAKIESIKDWESPKTPT